jgi:hypothetical protein
MLAFGASLFAAVGLGLGLLIPSDRHQEPRDVVVGEVNSADRLVFWTRCDDVAALSDTDLDEWSKRGVDGFVCMVTYLHGLGGTHAFTGNPGAALRGPAYALQRRLSDADLAARARRRGIKLYLGFYASSTQSRATPFADWFDDRRWGRAVLPRVAELAAAARRLGFAGLAVDQELYANNDTATWDWRYPGNTKPERSVREKVRQRGAELMAAMLRGFPRLDLMAYDTEVPGSWEALVQKRVNGISDAFAEIVQIDFWDGMSSIRGYHAIRWIDAIFYKTPHLSEANWDAALQYNANAVYSLLSRRFSNWKYASSRLHLSPFSWVDEGPGTDFERARDPEYVAEQLAAFRKWGTGREFANYAYNGLREFDYSAYVPGMRAASVPGQVDSIPPGLSVTGRSIDAGRNRVSLRGFATDNLAIRAVRWSDGARRSGVARLRWIVESGDPRSGWDWRMRWTAGDIPLSGRSTMIRITVEDIKGLTTIRTVRVRR